MLLKHFRARELFYFPPLHPLPVMLGFPDFEAFQGMRAVLVPLLPFPLLPVKLGFLSPGKLVVEYLVILGCAAGVLLTERRTALL